MLKCMFINENDYRTLIEMMERHEIEIEDIEEEIKEMKVKEVTCDYLYYLVMTTALERCLKEIDVEVEVNEYIDVNGCYSKFEYPFNKVKNLSKITEEERNGIISVIVNRTIK